VPVVETVTAAAAKQARTGRQLKKQAGWSRRVLPRAASGSRLQFWDAVVVSEEPIDQASERYDRAEQTYLAAIATGAGDGELRALARQVAEAARAWESADVAADAPPEGVTRYYEAPEVLSTLWRDVADAYDRRPG
jgi:hypothetical protein